RAYGDPGRAVEEGVRRGRRRLDVRPPARVRGRVERLDPAVLVEVGTTTVLEPGHDDPAGGRRDVGHRLGDAALPAGRDVAPHERPVRAIDLHEPAVALALLLNVPGPRDVAAREDGDADPVRPGWRL